MAFWIIVDLVFTSVFLALTMALAIAGKYDAALVCGLLMLFWQRELHRDKDRR